MKKIIIIFTLLISSHFQLLLAQKTEYIFSFSNENHPRIGYWFFTPTLIKDEKKALANIDGLTAKCNYTCCSLLPAKGQTFMTSNYCIRHCNSCWQRDTGRV